MDEARPVVREAAWAEDEPDIREVRQAVFHVEQGVPLELDFDGSDVGCLHALGLMGDAVVATGRVGPDGHIGRIAVLKAWRHHGIGRAVMDFLVSRARGDGFPGVYLHSQLSAVGFYAKLGFQQVGEPFVEAGIDHIEMELRFD